MKSTRLRWWFAFIFFLIGLIAYMDRSNLAYVAKPMMHDFGIDKVQFGLLSSLFSAGYAISQIPVSLLSEHFGPRAMVAIALFWWSLFTGLTAATRSFGLLATVRFLFGVGEGPMYPGNAVFNTFWFRKNEKGRAASALLAGSYFGPVVAPFLAVPIINAWGWHAVFYLFGVAGILMTIIWYLLARNKPEEHPRISDEELKLIQEGRDATKKDKEKAPWGEFLKNGRFWFFGIQYFVTLYAVTIYLSWLPTYLQEAHHVSLSSSALGTILPWFAIFLVVMTGGTISDRMVAKGSTKLKARASLAVIGLVLSAISMFIAAHTVSFSMTVFWLTISLGSLGLPVVTSWATATDLGKQYSGSVSGWMNMWGNIGAFASPLVCGWIATVYGWETVLITSIIPILIAIIMWFGVKPDKSLTEPTLENFSKSRTLN